MMEKKYTGMAGELFLTVSQLCQSCSQKREGLNEHKVLFAAPNRIKEMGRIIGVMTVICFLVQT